MSKTDTALVVIDVQVGLMEEVYQPNEMLATINQLLKQARESDIPVIYVQHDGSPGDSLAVGAPGWHIHPAIAPCEGEPIVRKRASDAFHETSLHKELEARGIKHLIVTGAQTNWCVNATASRAIYVGYDVTLVSDAHSTCDSETLSAPQIIDFYNELLNGYNVEGRNIRVKASNEISFV